MTDRMSPVEASLLALEEPSTPQHVGTVMVFEPGTGGFDPDDLTRLIEARIATVARYRQKVIEVPGHLAGPVWVDDADFDLGYHVRRSGLPRPGTDAQLEEFVARVASRPLDRERPLWEAYLVEGLERGRFAIVTKTHEALVDGVDVVDLAQLILSDAPVGALPDPLPWSPRPEPSVVDLMAGAAWDLVRSPGSAVTTVRGGIRDLKATVGRVADGVGTVVSTLARAGARPAPSSPLNVTVGGARRFVMVGTDLADYRRARAAVLKGRLAEDVTITDVVLATIAGALRIWLLTRGEAVGPATTVRAMVPVSFHGETDDPAEALDTTRLKACFVDLPVGEPSAAMRLHQIAFSMRQQTEGGLAVSADTLAGLGGFAPPTLHALGSRVGEAVSRRLYNVVITNVPGPQHPLYAGQARLLASYPVIPLGRGHGLAIGVTSYDGGVSFGLNADRDALPDADVLGQGLVAALDELIDAGRATRI